MPTMTEQLPVTRLRLAVSRLARRIRQEAAGGVTPSQLSALSSIGRLGPLRLGALAEHERVSSPTLTRIVAALEEAGYVVRRPDPADGRCAQVALTGAGERTLEASRHRADAYLADRISELSGEERDTIAVALPALERLLEVSE